MWWKSLRLGGIKWYEANVLYVQTVAITTGENTLLLTWTPLIFCYSTHITLISLCMAVLPSLRPPWLCLTFISSQIWDTTAAETGGFHTSILWASAWWALFTINKRIKPHWVWVQRSHSVRWEGRTVSISLFSPKFGNISWSSSG